MTCNAESNKVYKFVCVHIASKVNKLKKNIKMCNLITKQSQRVKVPLW